MTKLEKQRDALRYLIRHVDSTEKDKAIHHAALAQIEAVIRRSLAYRTHIRV